MTPPIRVAIVDDDREVRDGLTWLFRHSPGFKCVDSCASAEEALDKLPRSQPDVILLDIQMPGQSGIDCLPDLKRRCPTAQASILTVLEDDDLVFRSLVAGATGYLLKKTPPAGILVAVRDLHAGGSPMSSQIARKLLNVRMDQPALLPNAIETCGPARPGLPIAELCPRERQILDLLAQGFRYKEIAEQLGITIHTVRTFIRSMYEKLQVHSRTEAVLRVRRKA